MNDLLNNFPFLIATGAALLFLCFWGLCASKRTELKNKVLDLQISLEYANDRTGIANDALEISQQKVKEQNEKIECLEAYRKGDKEFSWAMSEELDALNKKLVIVGKAEKEAIGNLVVAMSRLQKLTFILKKLRPALYNQERIDAAYERLSNPRKIPQSITREAKEAAGTLAGIKKGGKA